MSLGTRGSILVVEDDASFRELLRTVLETRGFDVLVAEDGRHALDVVNGRSFDAVVTDYDMPRMNGLEFCRALRERAAPQERPVPIWVVTGAPGLTRGEALAAGATAMIRKPCQVFEISKAIERHLHGSRLPGSGALADLPGFLPARRNDPDGAGAPASEALPLS